MKSKERRKGDRGGGTIQYRGFGGGLWSGLSGTRVGYVESTFIANELIFLSVVCVIEISKKSQLIALPVPSKKM